MIETILKALLRLFAIIANVNEDGVSSIAVTIVKSYLEEHLSPNEVKQYLGLFNKYLKIHHRSKENHEGQGRKLRSSNAVKVLKICFQINEGLERKDKIIVLLRLLEFINEDEIITKKEIEFIETIVGIFKIERDEYENCKSLILEADTENIDKERLLIIDGKERAQVSEVQESGAWFEQNKPKSLVSTKHIYNENLKGKIVVLHLESINSFVFRYLGEEIVYLNSHNIIPERSYMFTTGAIIKGSRIQPIYYSDIAAMFIQAKSKRKIVFEARDVSFKFRNSVNGVQPFSFSSESGQLIGIMGGSGVGKSTLLNVLNGSLPLSSGSITINGYDLHRDTKQLEGVIGFVPQDDLLIEELTVYQNLYYNANLCFSNFTESQIELTIKNIMTDLDLYESRNLTVGNPLNKFISGGQRKRLNIALELMREPSILIVDEPTSGLSSMDSETVMSLLNEQTNKGKLVIVNIHQPSSDIFKLFDKLLVLDKGGYPVYFGDPIDAVVYFKTKMRHVNTDERECVTCGNVNPEQILQVIESKELNEYGKFTRNRKISPQEWYELYNEELAPKHRPQKNQKKSELPKNSFKIPNSIEQFKIFSARNLMSKLTDTQYLLISLLEAPLLAVILGYFTKYNHGTNADPEAYIFSENINIPAYLFMSIIVALFLGLTVSAEEIIKDRRILRREKYLHLSRIGYLNSKILFLFALSAIQSFLFVIIGNTILGIKGMVFSYWLVLFSTSCFANMLGLNISSGLNSVVNIYILIPFILVPQLLLSGVIVDFNKLHKTVSNPKYVPVVGDLMTSRWAYEALSVVQFKNNRFNQYFYPYDQKMSEASSQYVYIIPRLESMIDKCEYDLQNKAEKQHIEHALDLIKTEIDKLPFKENFWAYDSLDTELFNSDVASSVRKHLKKVSEHFVGIHQIQSTKKDSVYNKLLAEKGKDYIFELQRAHHNKRLAEFVSNKMELKKIKEYDGNLLQMNNAIYRYPQMNFGRAHFYAPVKKFLNNYIDTFWFNTCFIWLTTLFFYFSLQHDTLRKIITYFEHLKLRKRFG